MHSRSRPYLALLFLVSMTTAQQATVGPVASSQAAAAASSAIAAVSGFTDSDIPASLYSAAASEGNFDFGTNANAPSDVNSVIQSDALASVTGKGTSTGASPNTGIVNSLTTSDAAKGTGSMVISTGASAKTGVKSGNKTSKLLGSTKTPTPVSTRHKGVGAQATAGAMAGAIGVLGMAVML